MSDLFLLRPKSVCIFTLGMYWIEAVGHILTLLETASEAMTNQEWILGLTLG